ncbi:hypothetical protein KM043_007582 [Ampulex compressa]|nr:hypothetical protein KM043_007582 [Ampulex compressa]
MAVPSLKGTRKTYSFEEREILITLINKYEDIEDRKSDPISMCKRKSAWSQLAEEYNSMVGPQSVRSAVQLRRCWENMKACKKNREERKSRGSLKSLCSLTGEHDGETTHSWENGSRMPSTLNTPTSGRIVGLPPNVVFEPKDSEPFTLQSVCTPKPLKLHLRKTGDASRDPGTGAFKHASDLSGSKPEVVAAGLEEGNERSSNDLACRAADRMETAEAPENSVASFRSNVSQTLVSPSAVRNHPRRTEKSIRRDEELRVLALSEAQMKVDIAAMLKEEARIKLEEAHYRKEEARLRMLFFTYKLDRLKDD